MEDENTNYKAIDIFEAPKRQYAKYKKPTTVRVGAQTRAFLQEKEMPLSYLVRNAPRWHARALEAEDYRTNMNAAREKIIKMQNELLDLIDWKKRAMERLKKKNIDEATI